MCVTSMLLCEKIDCLKVGLGWALQTSGRSLSLILMHTCVLRAYLSGGYLPCKKDYKV